LFRFFRFYEVVHPDPEGFNISFHNHIFGKN
jgi:hypothetical protein